MFDDTIHHLLDRPVDSHKYSFGHVLVIGGSAATVGAPLLTARAALRSGAGLVTIAADRAVIDRLAGLVPEIMTLTITDTAMLADFIAQRKVSVVVVGPGLTVGDDTLTLLTVLFGLTVPLVIDGGALSSLAGHTPKLPAASNAALILTPHRGEFKRLLGTELATDTAGLQVQASDFVRDHQVELVVKGHPTLVVHPEGSTYENTSGGPGLATAGSGDVLAGIIGALIAQNVEPALAAEIGVYLHGLAGDSATAVKTQPGVIASDIIESLPQAFRQASGDAAA